MGVGGGGFGGLGILERGMMGRAAGRGRGSGACWLARGGGLWGLVRLWGFRGEGWGGRLVLVMVLTLEEKEKQETREPGGLGLGGRAVVVVEVVVAE